MDQIYNSMLAVQQNVNAQQSELAVNKDLEQKGTTFRDLLEKQKTDEEPVMSGSEMDSSVPVENTGSEEEQEMDLEWQLFAAAIPVLQGLIVSAEQVNQAPADNTFVAASVQAVMSKTELSADDTVSKQQLLMQNMDETNAGKVQQETRIVKMDLEDPDSKSTDSSNFKTMISNSFSETTEFTDGETALFNSVKDVMVKVGETAATEETEENSALVRKQIGEQITRALGQGETRISIRLNPQNLGQVDVEMTLTKQGELHIELRAENRVTERLLEREMTGLQSMLSRNTQQEVQVQVTRQEENQQTFDEEGKHEGNHQNPQQERREEHADSDFLQQLRLGLVPLDVEAS